MRARWIVALACALVIAGCGDGDELVIDGGVRHDAASAIDGGDAAIDDAGAMNVDAAMIVDAAMSHDDASVGDDAGAFDAGASDAGEFDAGVSDAGPADSGPGDSGPGDSGPGDSGMLVGDCLSGATGTHAVRFRWAGSGPGSTAYVMYERNQLPDTSRWRVTAGGMSIPYTPRFDDVFLGEGGLDLGSTNFIDVELSTMGLTSIRNVTIAVYGRSFNTTASGSFSWQTFDGMGASPSSSLANSAPYEWYPADATTAFRAGNAGVLLRLRAGPSSNRIVVNRVEICFDAAGT